MIVEILSTIQTIYNSFYVKNDKIQKIWENIDRAFYEWLHLLKIQ